MSPLNVRRYRAERMLRGEFEALRSRVLATAGRRLAASGVVLDDGDLEACYSQAWQGLYMVVLEGQEIANPAGWLVLASFRRGIEEHRSRRRLGRPGAEPGELSDGAPLERDLAGDLDDRMRLRQLFEGLQGRLGAREREAAVLCYLQGLTRAQAAVRMGISDARMRKLMEGGAGRLGVAAKVGSLVESIRDGRWCEEQGSLMRALAFGLLDPAGERHTLALAHCGQCPACRAYVISLRGVAVVLPPVLLPWGLSAGALARAVHGHAAGVGAAAAPSAGAQAGSGLLGSGFAAPAAGAGGAAGGGWLLAGGPLTAKLAVGCLLALGVGASCVELGAVSGHVPRPAHLAHHSSTPTSSGARAGESPRPPTSGGPAVLAATAPAGNSTSAPAIPLTSGARASREFGPEHGAVAPSAVGAGGPSGQAQIARVAQPPTAAAPLAGGSQVAAGTSSSSAGASQAAREFSPG
ncbi:MAG TPA: hypothetical protein VII01_13880 [Solirubrobacteraceae bacterium]